MTAQRQFSGQSTHGGERKKNPEESLSWGEGIEISVEEQSVQDGALKRPARQKTLESAEDHPRTSAED